MSVTYTDIQALAPGEFASTPTSYINDAILEASLLLDEGSWGDYYDRALTLATAHILATSLQGSGGGQAGAIASMTAGQVSVSYGGAGGGSLWGLDWGSTGYGVRLKALMRKVFGGPRVV